MNFSHLLLLAKDQLSSRSIANPSLDALILLSFATSLTKEQIIFNPDLKPSETQEKLFFELLERRLNNEPISHIIGKREFFALDFVVNKNVLDPRPDSEILIELVLKKNPDKKTSLKILELGVGSGCLIITLLKNYLSASGVGVDLSAEALKICEQNSLTHKVNERLTLLQSDLFSKISDKFDLIISNPPYIPSAEILTLQPEVQYHEPHMALDGGFDGLDFYRRIACEAHKFLNKNARIIVEIGYNQESAVVDIFVKNNFTYIDFARDLAGITRILEFQCN